MAALAFALAAVPAPATATLGALDPAFDHRGMVAEPFGRSAAAGAAAVQRNGDIVTAGEAQLADGKLEMISTRIRPNGRLDTGYGKGGWVALDIGGQAGGSSVAIQRNGDIVLAGGARTTAFGHPIGFAAVRLLPNGRLDPSFGDRGEVTVPIGSDAIAWSVAVQPDGRIVLAGSADDPTVRIAAVRLNRNGSLDTGFGNRGVTVLNANAAGWAMALEPNGDIVLAGDANPLQTRGVVGILLGVLGGAVHAPQAYIAARLLPDGQPDPTFGRGGLVTTAIGVKALCDAVAVQPNGDIVMAGNAYTTIPLSATVRLLPSGALDPSFGSGGMVLQPLWEAINAIALEPDGHILLAGVGPTAIELTPSGSPFGLFGHNGIDDVADSRYDAANGVAINHTNGDIVLAGAIKLSNRIELSVTELRGS
jgi:uncharacterized delta-60 repeat protein